MSVPNRHRQVCDRAGSYAAKSIPKFNVSVMQPWSYFEASFYPCLAFFFIKLSSKNLLTRESEKAGTKSRCGARISLYSAVIYIRLSLTAVCELTTFHSHISIFSRPRSSVSPSLPASPAALSISLTFSLHNYQCH